MRSSPCTRNGARPPDGGVAQLVTEIDQTREEAIAEENVRMRRLRLIASLTTAELMQSQLSLAEARAIVERMRRATLALFPGSEATFDLIYATRFERIIRGRFGRPAGGGTVQ